MEPFQSFDAKVFGSTMKSICDALCCLHTKNLIEISFDVSVTKLTRNDFARRSYTIFAYGRRLVK